MEKVLLYYKKAYYFQKQKFSTGFKNFRENFFTFFVMVISLLFPTRPFRSIFFY